jgi:hypothetical protein
VIAALAGSSKGAIDPVAVETKTAAAAGEEKPSIFKRKKKKEEAQPASEVEVAEAPADMPEQGDTDDSKTIPGSEALAGSSIKKVEVPPAQAGTVSRLRKRPRSLNRTLSMPLLPQSCHSR